MSETEGEIFLSGQLLAAVSSCCCCPCFGVGAVTTRGFLLIGATGRSQFFFLMTAFRVPDLVLTGFMGRWHVALT